MPDMTVNGATLHYTDVGDGRPVVLLHGVWMSSRFFQKQAALGSMPGCRVITIDFRGHGQSAPIDAGHTVANYAADVRAVLETLEVTDAVLVGWSMGAFVAWEYLTAYDDDVVTGLVVVDESASDFAWPGWEYGVIDMPTLAEMADTLQLDQRALAAEFVPEMFADADTTQQDWMVDELCRVQPNTATSILVSQTLVDYRDRVAAITVPTLLCFGRVEKLVKVAAGEDLAARIPDSRLVVFENSCHCPFFEEPDRFNQIVGEFATTNASTASAAVHA